jgi:FSR family fosmidomycin resistance protein-like MFS transporter
MNKRVSGNIALGFASIGHTYSHLFVLFYATVVLVLEREWGLSYSELFALSIPGAIMFGVAALPAGWLGDKWSAAGMIAVYFIGTGASSVFTGLAQGPLGIAIGLTAIGTFAAIYHPVGIPWLIKNAVNRGRALGISGLFGSAGTALSALVAGALADLFGWRAAFIVPGVICLATGVVFIALMRAGVIVDTAEEAAPTPPPPATEIRRAFMVLAVTVVCVGVIYQATSYALPKVFEERLSAFAGNSVFGIGGMVSICYGIAALTQLIGGELADRYSQKMVYMLSHLTQVPLYAIGYILFGPALLPVAAAMLAFNILGQPSENALLARYTPLKWRGQVFGAKFVLTLGVSSLGVAIIPVIHATAGNLDGLFLLLAASAFVAAAASTLLPADRPKLAQTLAAGSD